VEISKINALVLVDLSRKTKIHQESSSRFLICVNVITHIESLIAKRWTIS